MTSKLCKCQSTGKIGWTMKTKDPNDPLTQSQAPNGHQCTGATSVAKSILNTHLIFHDNFP